MSDKPLIQFHAVTKRWGDCYANNEVTFSVKHGSIHGIIGENGAGKSTAMKLFYGIYPPTSGKIYLNNAAIEWRSPQDAISAGIGMVHQHFLLAEGHTVLDNIILGAEGGSSWGMIARDHAKSRLHILMEKHGFHVPLEKNIEEISVGEQQKVEILKILYRDARILILDEPTAVLAPREVDEFFSELRRLRDSGCTILLITHKLKEVMALTDHISVFRAGKVVAERETKNTSQEELAELMIGVRASPIDVPQAATEKSLLQLDWRGQQKIEVHAGEILGIAGVEGNGQHELLNSVLFPNESKHQVKWFDTLANNWDAEEVRLSGVSVFSENRIQNDLVENFSLLENLLLNPKWRQSFSKCLIQLKKLKSIGADILKRFDVRPADLSQLAGALSGGNQQKFVAARELNSTPKFLVAAHPTRGVDIGAARFIHDKIRAVAAANGGVLLVSSDIDELRALSNRIIVLYQGKISGEFSFPANEQEIGLAMTGAKS